jgi:hypothetical protein
MVHKRNRSSSIEIDQGNKLIGREKQKKTRNNCCKNKANTLLLV